MHSLTMREPLSDGGHSSQSSLADLPNELLEKVFLFCDGITIKRLSAVCKKFNTMVINLSRLKDVWKKCVFTEIGKEIADELSRYCSGGKRLDNSLYLNDFYYKLYVKWCRSLNVGKWPSTDTPINGFFQNPISCIKVSGDLIIMGHKDGCVSICDYLSQNIEIACRHIRMVTDIALIDLAGQDSYSIFKSRVGAISNHHHIVSISKDQNVRVYPIQSASIMNKYSHLAFKPASSELNYVRVFGEYCAIYANSMKIFLWKMSLSSPGCVDVNKPLNFSLFAVVTSPDRLPGWFNLWENKVRCFCAGRGILHEINVENAYSCSSRRLRLPRLGTGPYSQYISRAFVLRKKTIILVMVSGLLYYSIDGETLHDFPIYKHFTSKVITLALWGGILALGLECGQLAIYRCPTISDLALLHDQKPVYKLHLDRRDEPIISLDIDDYGKGPVVVAATHNAVSVLKWFSSDD
ncbi:hypothetical protein B4U79_17728 [Dinothrombium tinctorium]|uniref:F-box domain-containing protein n=1 Tax=Dinothrombium tinctorium TaxID=1965070 RepID=A0A3S3RTF0_9ACAR|nr:hypothetical protein B4U79_16276 [Dinothrombium tinctorium]RWS09054.1 hypothetical protein B4U79_17728 [Dinothrombium tinctorium]